MCTHNICFLAENKKKYLPDSHPLHTLPRDLLSGAMLKIQETIFTSLAVMKKFHGDNEPKPNT